MKGCEGWREYHSALLLYNKACKKGLSENDLEYTLTHLTTSIYCLENNVKVEDLKQHVVFDETSGWKPLQKNEDSSRRVLPY